MCVCGGGRVCVRPTTTQNTSGNIVEPRVRLHTEVRTKWLAISQRVELQTLRYWKRTGIKWEALEGLLFGERGRGTTRARCVTVT